jgi:hypothetical protein
MRDGRLWCATQRDSRIATLLARDPRSLVGWDCRERMEAA